MTIYTFDVGKNKDVFCGVVEKDIFKRVVDNKHFMVKYGGYGIQKDVLSKLVLYGVRFIEITTKKKTKYKSTIGSWVSKGKVGKFGHGEQVFLNIKFMTAV